MTNAQMSYDYVANASSILGLIFFMMLFAVVVFWALWPKNKKNFEQAARIPLEEPDLADRETKNHKP